MATKDGWTPLHAAAEKGILGYVTQHPSPGTPAALELHNIMSVWQQAIRPKKWRENFPTTKIALSRPRFGSLTFAVINRITGYLF